MNQLDIFKYQDQQVRTIVDEAGEPWFVATDVARILGLKNSRDAIGRVDSDGVGNADVIDSIGRTQNASTVNESGLYELIFQSRVPGARQFKRWVTREVLPSIRKTGSYGQPSELEAQVPKSLPEALRAYAREVEAREAMECYARELEPKAGAYDTFLSGDGTYSVGNVAKMYGLSQTKLFNLLRSAGVLIAKGHMHNTPYQKYMHHFTVRGGTFTRSDGTEGNSYTTRVQPSGVDFIARKLGLSVQEVAA